MPKMPFAPALVAALVLAASMSSPARAQAPRTAAPDVAGTANDPTIGDNSAPSSLSGAAAAQPGAPIDKDLTKPGTLPGDHLGSQRDAGSKGK